MLYNPNKTKLIKYPINNENTNYKIPYSTREVGAYAFNGCTNLESITIPNMRTHISFKAFDKVDIVTIYGYKYSYAYSFAKDKDYPFKIINTNIFLNKNKLEFSEPPTIIGGRTLVPLNDLSKILDLNVESDDKTYTHILIKSNKKIEVKLEKTSLKVDDEIVKIDIPATWVKGVSYVPLRFIAENYGFKVDWNGATKSVFLSGQN